MSKVHSVSVKIGGRDLTFETGKVAKQASGAVIVSQDDSQVLVTAVADTKTVPFDFVPLTVDYQDKAAASGKIPGGFLKREGRADERMTLTSRLIDRPLRPQFEKHWRNETQVIATVLSFDTASDTDVLSICGASAACALSDIPQKSTVAGVRVCEIDGKLVINPSREAMVDATLALVVAGNAEAIAMVEGGADEATEDRILEAMDVAHKEIVKICKAIDKLAKAAGKEKRALPPAPSADADLAKEVEKMGAKPLVKAMSITGKHERKYALKAARDAIIQDLTADMDEASAALTAEEIKIVWESMIKKQMRKTVIEKGVRIDGRKTNEIRAISCEVGILKRTHGSALFQRGETQAIATCTLGVEDDAQRIDFAGSQNPFRRFMLEYGFPPYCTGEVKRLGAPKRREVGHGALARRAVAGIVPSQDKFPYVIRVTSEVTESNGSSSMASACGATLAMMDAGVPIKAPVAGIAMGLVKEGSKFAVLSDILGDEDALGDMDFKVTGTKDGVTAFQMDAKISGVPREVMQKALAQAKEGRVHILGEMLKAIKAPRTELSAYAPRIYTLQINTEKIRDLIGPGGKVIRGIQDQTGVKISVEDNGVVTIASSDQASTDKAIGMVREITQEAEIGKLYLGVVKRIVDFGAFVEIFPGTDGLIHISHLANERVNKVTDVVHEGDEVLVRVIDIDKQGKIRLSRKEALEASGM